MRLLVVATAQNHVGITRQLAEAADGEIGHIVTFGGRDADYKASSLYRLTSAEGTRGHVMEGDSFTGLGLALTQRPGYEAVLLEAMDTLQRGSEAHVYRNHALRAPSDYVNYVNIIADRMAGILRDEAIDTLLFFDVPHLFYDSLMYHVAKATGRRTLVLRVAHIPQRFYSMSDIRDLGHVRPQPDARPFPLEKGKPPELYYMKGIKQEKAETGRVTPRALAHLAAHVATQEPSLALRPRRLWSIFRRMDAAARQLPKWRDPFARFFHTDSLQFAEQLAEIERTEPDLDRPFVYVPLQWQPEMTTTILGGLYRDQAMAVEAIAAMLPEGHLVYVKENPKQDGRYRRPMFYHRLRRIPQVRLMPSYANTHELTARSRFVATISGTVAWEALLMGRPALVFGDSWMQSLPGVTRYRPGLTFDEVAGAHVDHAALERGVGALMAASHEGVLPRHVARLDAAHDAGANAATVARTILSLLRGETPLSFTAPEERA